ncbi:MAG: right-handed parallel beta-helix repeat-containing protein [Candidatus Methanospirareceae archaeon]
MKYEATVLLFAVLLGVFVGVSAGSVTGAEAPEEEWNLTYGGSNYDYGYAVQQTTDGGYIITGYTQSFGIDAPDAWLIKTAANGTKDWSRTFGGPWYDSGYSVQQTIDGGYIVAGSTHTYEAGPNDVWLIKTAANGSADWKRTFGGALNDYGYSVQQTSDGGYIVAGSTASFSAGTDDDDVWLIKTAANGLEEWNRTFGGSSDDVGHSVQQTTDGSYIVAGSTKSFSASSGDVWLLKVAANGTELWNRTFGGSSDDVGYSVQQTNDGGYIVAGSTKSFSASSGDVWLLKVAANGTAEWNSTLGGFSDDTGYSVQQTIGGGYIIAGSTKSFGAGSGDLWLLKTAANGTEVWNMTLGGGFDDGGHAVQQTTDGGYIVAGYTHSFGERSGDVWLIKLARETMYVPDQYPTIQQAVDNASSDDMIIVRDGEYTENVYIDVAHLTIRSENGSENCIVQAANSTEHVFTVAAEWVNISGFTLTEATGNDASGLRLGPGVEHCTITNNTASGNSHGFSLESADHNILRDNIGCNNTLCGFELVTSYDNLISGNDLYHNQVGLSLLVRCDDNRIVNNTVYENTLTGINLRSDCDNTTISGNHVYKNNVDGISIMAVTNITVSDNLIYNNSRIGIYLWLFGTSDDIISGNKIYDNGDGIILRNSSSSSSINCYGNEIYNNNYGIEILESDNVTVGGNIVTSNYCGIYLWLNSSHNCIYNNIFENDVNAYDTGINIWNITPTQGTNILGGTWLGGNYWSDYTGKDTNSDGLGNTMLPYNASGGIKNGGDWMPLIVPFFAIFDTGKGTYPSIPGMHNGTITPFYDLSIRKLFTYPCPGTGGHTEYVKIWNNTGWNVTAMWAGYTGDWHNLSFNSSFTLYANETYTYTIQTGSYPQIIHAPSWNATGGTITCEEFVDVNGKRHAGWIPAIRLQ